MSGSSERTPNPRALLARSNHRVARLRRLGQDHRERVREQRILVEGPTLLNEALDAGLPVERLFVDVDRRGEDLDTLLDRLEGRPLHRVASGVLNWALPTVSPQGVAGIVGEPPAADLDVLLARALAAKRPLLGLVSVGEPGNLGTMIRTAEAAGCVGVVLVGDGVDLWNPKAVRAAAGASFRMPYGRAGDEVVEVARRSGVAVAATTLDGTVGHLDAPLSGPVLVLMGNEARGLDEAIGARCDHRIRIEMDGPTESLNVAHAATVVLFEALRQRRAAGNSENGRGVGARLGPECRHG
ncbi:MAG: RNA methyltransferase [Microthrixaceae bacterium]